MKKVLLVYEEVPESTKIFKLEVSDADFRWMKKCHMHLVNQMNDPEIDEALDKLSLYLEGKKPVDLDAGPLNLADSDVLILSGFIL